MKAARSLLFAAAVTSLSAFASSWDIDPAHTTASFTVKHMMVSNVTGSFGKVSGSLNLDEKKPTNSTVSVTIDATTIDTREPKRDGHLKSKDFFEVEKFPEITFKSTKIAPAGKDRWKVTGDLAMHGVTKPVVLNVEMPKDEFKDMQGKAHRGAHAETTVNRKDWGLVWNVPLAEKGGLLVGDQVKIVVDAEFVRSDTAPDAKQAEAAQNKTEQTAPAKTTQPAK